MDVGQQQICPDNHHKSSWKHHCILSLRKELMLPFIPIFFTFSLLPHPISISPSLSILNFLHLSVSSSSFIKQLSLFFSSIYFPVNEWWQWCLLCTLWLCSLTSFSSQLRFGSSASVLLSRDSHTKEQAWLLPLKLWQVKGEHGREASSHWKARNMSYPLQSAILKVIAEKPSLLPDNLELSLVLQSENFWVRDRCSL